MISNVLAILLLTSAQGAADPNKARQAYSKCLTATIKADLKEKMEPAAFEAKLPSACKAEEDSFRRLMVASDLARGIKRDAAEEGVNSEIADYQSSAKEEYRVFMEPAAATPK